MKKVCLALLVLALTIPTMGAVNITLVPSIPVGSTEANMVTVHYQCTAGEEVRAFALDITVSDAALITSTVTRLGGPQGHDANYYITPTNVGFTTISGVLRPWPYNSPAVDANASKFTLEMGSLYASNDPCNAHKFPPPSQGDLLSFRVNKALRGADNTIIVTVTGANAKRGKVVLKGPPVTSVDPVLPGPLNLVFDCLQQGETCGGVAITAGMAANWVTAGKPTSWCHPGHFAGDANQDCTINAIDVIGPGLPNFKAAFNQAWPAPGYAPACDTNNDLLINAVDVIGGDPLCPNCSVKTNFNTVIVGKPPLCP